MSCIITCTCHGRHAAPSCPAVPPHTQAQLHCLASGQTMPANHNDTKTRQDKKITSSLAD